jgi:hypothetical protein
MELTAKKRNSLGASAFGLPDKRAYPEEDAPHVANAEARAKQELEDGHLTQDEYDQIMSKADRYKRLHGVMMNYANGAKK